MTIVSEKELSEKLKVNRRVLIKLRRNGIPHIIVGEKLIRYDYEQVLEYLKNQDKTERKEGMKNENGKSKNQ